MVWLYAGYAFSLACIYNARTPRTMPQCARMWDIFAANRAAMPFMSCVFRLRRGILPPPNRYSPKRSYSMYYKFVMFILQRYVFFPKYANATYLPTFRSICRKLRKLD